MADSISFDTFNNIGKQFSCFDEKEKSAFEFKKNSFTPVFYPKFELGYTPETEDYSYFGGTGVSCKFGKTKVDALFAGKTAKEDEHGYLADVVIEQGWPNFMQPFDNLSFSSNLRVRNNHCGSNNMQYRITPLKLSYTIDDDLVTVDNIYVYPAYVTVQDDLKGDNDSVKFGSIIGISKKICDRNYYFEVQADTTNERSSDVNLSLNVGFKL